jgi:ABC-type uncharacterized transport system ATPase subunit
MSAAIAVMINRMKSLPRRLCIAHLRALIRQPSLGPRRRAELASLLRAELMAPSPKQGRAT